MLAPQISENPEKDDLPIEAVKLSQALSESLRVAAVLFLRQLPSMTATA